MLPVAQQRRRGVPLGEHLANCDLRVLLPPTGKLLGNHCLLRLDVVANGRVRAPGDLSEPRFLARPDCDQLNAAGRRLIKGIPDRGLADRRRVDTHHDRSIGVRQALRHNGNRGSAMHRDVQCH